MLMAFVHQNTNAVEQITIKYLEKGHTSMSADPSHRQVQRNLSKRKVCDFEDFSQAVKDTGIKTTTMTHDDFFVIQDVIPQKKLNLLGKEGSRPYLGDTCCLQVRMGSEDIHLKKSHLDRQWKSFSVTKATFDPYEPPLRRSKPYGVNKAKIEKAVDSLLPLMPAHKQRFWSDLLYHGSAGDATSLAEDGSNSMILQLA